MPGAAKKNYVQAYLIAICKWQLIVDVRGPLEQVRLTPCPIINLVSSGNYRLGCARIFVPSRSRLGYYYVKRSMQLQLITFHNIRVFTRKRITDNTTSTPTNGFGRSPGPPLPHGQVNGPDMISIIYAVYHSMCFVFESPSGT